MREGSRAHAKRTLGLLVVSACAAGQPQPDSPAAARAASTSGAGAPASPAADDGGAEATAVVQGNGPRATDFELDRLDGGSFRLSERLGQDVILIDFWATYCEPCLAAMPHLNELYVKHKEQGLLVLGVSIDGPGSSAEVHSTVARLGVQFPILLDADSHVVSQYNPRVSAPYSVLIGRDGRVIARQEGYTSGKGEVLKQNIERALGAKP
jgi:peroxiredoxin